MFPRQQPRTQIPSLVPAKPSLWESLLSKLRPQVHSPVTERAVLLGAEIPGQCLLYFQSKCSTGEVQMSDFTNVQASVAVSAVGSIASAFEPMITHTRVQGYFMLFPI